MATQKKESGSSKGAVKIRPLGDRVLVKAVEQEDEQTTAAGIIIPKGAEKEEPKRGEVVAVGPGRENEAGKVVAPAVSIGDTILFSSYAFDKVEIDDTEYYVVNESNILAIIT